jgi:hypothetical protein
MAKALIALLLVLLAGPAFAAEGAHPSRVQIEQLLSSQIPSGSSAATVARFLDSRGVAHGVPEQSGPSVILTGTFKDVAVGAKASERGRLQVRFSFLQDRLIGYSFLELPAAP